MVTARKVRIIALTAGGLALSLACGKGKSPVPGVGGSDGGGDSSSSSGETTTVTMQGSLALTTSDTAEAGSAALDGTYDFYCVTFTESPNGCKVAVNAATAEKGTFSQDCENFAKAAFGCFIRKDGKTLTTVEFGTEGAALNLTTGTTKDTSLVVGGGSLVFDVAYDKSTNMAFAKIDTTQSTALGGAGEGTKTVLPDMSGRWKLTCDADDPSAGLSCPPDMANNPEGFQLLFSQFDHKGQTKLAMWENEETKNVCLAGGSEALPNFRIRLGSEDVPVKVGSTEEFVATVDAIYAKLDSDLKEEILKAAKNRSHVQHCANNPFQVDNCTLATMAIEEHKFIDEQGNEQVKRWPKWPNNWSEVEDNAYTASDATPVQQQCFVKDPIDGLPPCPWGTKDEGGGKGTMTTYEKNGSQVFLFCKDPNDQQKFHGQPASAQTVAEAIKPFSGGSEECAMAKSGAYAGMRYGEIDEVRRAVYQLFDKGDHGGPSGDSCSRFRIPDGFNFNKCKNGTELEVCWMVKDQHGPASRYGLKLNGSTGLLVADESTTAQWFEMQSAEYLCPETGVAYNTAMNSKEGQKGDQTAFVKQCAQEFVATNKDGVAQATALQKSEMRWRPIGQIISCFRPESDPIRKKIDAAHANSCLPRVRYDKFCFKGGCTTTLRCEGSAADGQCYADDMFVGRINGRDSIMDLKPSVDGAFAMYEKSVDRWERYDQEKDAPVACHHAKQFVLNGRMLADNQFKGVVNSTSSERCDNDESKEGSGGEGGGDGSGMEGGSGEGDGKEGGKDNMSMGIIGTKM